MTGQEILNLLQTALAHHNAGRRAEAEPLYRRVLEIDPGNHDALHLLGVLLTQSGRVEDAIPLLSKAVAIHPQMVEFHRHLADALGMAGRYPQALTSYQNALQLNPRDPLSRAGAGAVLLNAGRFNDAVEQIRIAAELQPGDPGALGNFGTALSRAGRFADAVNVLSRAVMMGPNVASVWMQYAEALWRLDRLEEALRAARRSLELNPNDALAHVLHGNVLQVMAEFEQAVEAYRTAAKLHSNSHDALNNIGLTLLKMGEATEALKVLEDAVQRWPQSSDVRANRSLALLTLGDLEHGLPEYESRWQSPAFAKLPRQSKPRWDGSELGGKAILLEGEQGMGDTIQFVRYAPMVAARGGHVIVMCGTPLHKIVSTVDGVSGVVAKGMLPLFDVHLPLASLPFVFRTTLESIPATVPYVRSDAARVEAWRKRLADDANFKVGIAWAGSPGHQNDRSRSTTLAAFAPVLAVEGATLYSLQKGDATRQIEAARENQRVIPLGHELNDFSDTAALLENLDLVISVDTSIVHLAGALARPVWTLLPRGPDWRWMLDREDSPWYPTMRLFRQERVGDWAGVFERVARELGKLITAR